MEFFSYADFLQLKQSDGQFNRPFEDFMVFHKMEGCVALRDEFSMLVMGGEL